MTENFSTYQHLIAQYQQLSVMEKQAILIYQSRLFNLINAITGIPNFENLTSQEIIQKLPNVDILKEEVEQFRKVLYLNENMIVRYSGFQLVNLNNFNILVDDLKKIYFILEEAKDKLILDRDLIVYRGISLEQKEDLVAMARGNIISTSIKREGVEPFIFESKEAILYVIQLKKGTPVLVTPTSLIRTYRDEDDYLEKKLNGQEPTLLKLINRGDRGQQEIILFKNSLSFISERVEEKFVQNNNLLIHYIETEPKFSYHRSKK